MTSIKSIKYNFERKLKNVFSKKELQSIWHQWVLKKMLKISLLDYLINPGMIVDVKKATNIQKLILYLSKNRPVQYFFGYTYFQNLKIHVNPDVLIPRPETEELVNLVSSSMSNKKKHNILDIGTGSGCISIALAKNSRVKIIAIDNSIQALKTAKLNADFHNVGIDFKHVDILEDVSMIEIFNFDIIVSNPPYVIYSDIDKSSNIHHEPYSAIFAPSDNPLVFYRKIISFANKNLNKGGKLFLEINPKFLQDLLNICSHYSFKNIKIHNDFHGKKRFIVVYS